MAIYRMKNGQQVPVKRSEIRRTIMQANDWTADEYRKQYDIFKNKLRFYEEMQRARGNKAEIQSPQEVLYWQAKAKLNYGAGYEPSQQMNEILSAPAYSISKGRRIATQTESAAFKRAASSIVHARFAGFIEHYDKAKEIVEKISDPIEQENALTALANYLWLKYPNRKKKPTEAIPNGDTYGSGDADAGDDFYIDPWLD